MFGCPHMFGYLPVCWDVFYMFGYPLYVWAPLCLDATCMFGCPHMFGCPLCVWKVFRCPLYIQNTKKACFVRLRGCPYSPLHLDTPLYVWIPPVCLAVTLYVWMPPVCLGASKHTVWTAKPVCLAYNHLDAFQTCGGIRTHTEGFHALSGHPTIQRGVHIPPYIWSTQTCMFGMPNICLAVQTVQFGCPQTCMGASKHTGGAAKHMEGILII